MTRRLRSISLMELFLALKWFAVLVGAWTTFPNWLANVVMVVGTLVAFSLALLGLMIGTTRAKMFTSGALPPLFVALTDIQRAAKYLPLVYEQSLVISSTAPLTAAGSDADPFADCIPYFDFHRVAIVMHFVAAAKALNSDEFRYGKGGQAAQDSRTVCVLTDKFPGFLTEYSTTAVEEDKAEVFAHLIVHAVHVGERTERDKVLDAKVGRMKKLLGTFCGAMNAEFCEKVRHVQRTEE